jgi:hypothetical protein
MRLVNSVQVPLAQQALVELALVKLALGGVLLLESGHIEVESLELRVE